MRVPGLRRFFRWRYARFVFQLPLLLLAAFAVFDGLSGDQLAPRNLATTTLWLHYRGLVVLALAVVGNAFCAACPLMLTRGLSRRLERLLPRKLSWPRALKNKYFVIALLLAFFFSYEVFDLWASPFLTAWLVIGYFAGALAVDTLFPAGTFCRYVCPLGAALAIPGRLRMFEWLKRWPECGSPCHRCAKECPVQAIHPEGNINVNECIYCMHCQELYHSETRCPHMMVVKARREKIARSSVPQL